MKIKKSYKYSIILFLVCAMPFAEASDWYSVATVETTKVNGLKVEKPDELQTCATAQCINKNGMETNLNPNSHPGLEIGLGYDICPKLHVEFLYNWMQNKYAASGSYTYLLLEQGTNQTQRVSFSGKGGNKITSNVFSTRFVYDLLDEKQNKVVPFVFLGAGAARNKSDDLKIQYESDVCGNCTNTFPGDRKTSFAWNLGGGFKVFLNDKMALTFSGKYFDNGKIRSKGRIYHGYQEYGDSIDYDPKNPIAITKNHEERIETKIRGFGASMGLIFKF